MMFWTNTESLLSVPELTVVHPGWLCVYSENVISFKSILHLPVVEAHKPVAWQRALPCHSCFPFLFHPFALPLLYPFCAASFIDTSYLSSFPSSIFMPLIHFSLLSYSQLLPPFFSLFISSLFSCSTSNVQLLCDYVCLCESRGSCIKHYFCCISPSWAQIISLLLEVRGIKWLKHIVPLI